jgi:hypothetical protein
MASEATDEAAARWFRMLAADYLDLAEREASQQREQMPLRTTEAD